MLFGVRGIGESATESGDAVCVHPHTETSKSATRTRTLLDRDAVGQQQQKKEEGEEEQNCIIHEEAAVGQLRRQD